MGKYWDEVKVKGSSHYKTGQIEPIDLIKDLGLLQGFALGNIIKYASRNRSGDLDKIAHYTQMLIAAEEEKKSEK